MRFVHLRTHLFRLVCITGLLWPSGCAKRSKGFTAHQPDGYIAVPSTDIATNPPPGNSAPSLVSPASSGGATTSTAPLSLNPPSLFGNFDWAYPPLAPAPSDPAPNLATRPFAQIIDYCIPEIHQLTGTLSLSNPLSIPVTVGVKATLVYYAGALPNVRIEQETTETTLILLPGQVKQIQLTNSHAGYGCHGITAFFGLVNGPLALQNLAISGQLDSTELRIVGPTQPVSSTFTVGPGFPSQPSSSEVSILKNASYCSPYQSYLQGQFIVYNPTSRSVQGSSDLKMKYLIAGGVPQEENAHVNISIPPAGHQLFTITSTQPGYGCYGNVSVSGVIKNLGSVPMIGSGNLLTSLADGGGLSGFGNVPFSVNNGLPF